MMTPELLADLHRIIIRNLHLVDVPRITRTIQNEHESPVRSPATDSGPKGGDRSDPTYVAATRRRQTPSDMANLAEWLRAMHALSIKQLALMAVVTADPAKHGPCWLCHRGGPSQRLSDLGECAKCIAACAKAVDRGKDAEQWRNDRRQNQNLSGITEKVSNPRPNND